MTVTHTPVSVDKLHHLATEAGFEEDFLSHFGKKIVSSKNVEDIEFWIVLVQRKLSVAFERESVNKGKHSLTRFLPYHIKSQVHKSSLPTLGFLAYLGRIMRLFLARHNIKDLDEPIEDFLCYLEGGILFIYPEFFTLSEHQLLMEVIIDEIGWLEFYATYNCQLFLEMRKSKDHPIQENMEIILFVVFIVCYHVISGFTHCNNSTQQTLGADLLEFLLQSHGLLSTCLEDYWAAYDIRTGDLEIIGERNGPDSTPSLLIKGTKNSSLIMVARQGSTELRREIHQPESP